MYDPDLVFSNSTSSYEQSESDETQPKEDEMHTQRSEIHLLETKGWPRKIDSCENDQIKQASAKINSLHTFIFKKYKKVFKKSKI